MPKTKGERPTSKPFGAFTEQQMRMQIRKNLAYVTNVAIRLQHQGEIEAALDLSREAVGSASSRAALFKLHSQTHNNA